VGLFGRRGRSDGAPADSAGRDQAAITEMESGPAAALAADSDDETALRPVAAAVGEDDQRRIAAAVEALAAEGVDVDDLSSLGAGYDAAYTAWASSPEKARPDHAAIVERYALGVGEHLHRHTDLDWQVVTDVFGTDLGVSGGAGGSFVVVPGNLVAARWMRGETGWLPGVVGHLVQRRARR
jgi:hypothetical protein